MKKQIFQFLDVDDFPSASEDLDTACDNKGAFLVFVDRKFCNSLRSALERHPDQTVSIIRELASPNLAEFTFEGQRKPVSIYKNCK